MNRTTAHPLLFLVLLAFASVLVTNVLATSFQKLGMPASVVMLVVLGSLLGSFVNVPVWLRRLPQAVEAVPVWPGHVLYRVSPRTGLQVIAVNLGGAIVPAAVSIWLMPQAPAWKLALAVAVVAGLTKALARFVPGVGIELPGLLPPVAAGLLGWLLAGFGGPEAAPIAYVSGTLGTLLGADVFNLRQVISGSSEPGILSIGGAGVFDGVFLVGVVAAFLV